MAFFKYNNTGFIENLTFESKVILLLAIRCCFSAFMMTPLSAFSLFFETLKTIIIHRVILLSPSYTKITVILDLTLTQHVIFITTFFFNCCSFHDFCHTSALLESIFSLLRFVSRFSFN
jgi:ABC-type uncharacterized transport system permease subunit